MTSAATYPLGSVPTAGCRTTDAVSGVAVAGTVNVERDPAGLHRASCTGSDVAGNDAGTTFTYSVTVSSRAGRQGFIDLFLRYVAASPTQPKRSFIRNVTAAVNDQRWCKVIRNINNPAKNSLSAGALSLRASVANCDHVFATRLGPAGRATEANCGPCDEGLLE